MEGAQEGARAQTGGARGVGRGGRDEVVYVLFEGGEGVGGAEVGGVLGGSEVGGG
jgi:hypothetical protein